VKRREFITLLGGAAVVWPLAAGAQQPAMPVIGVLRPNRKGVLETFAEPFRRYMKAIGWEEGRNIRFLFVWMEARGERAPVLADELVAQNVDLIVTFGDPARIKEFPETEAVSVLTYIDKFDKRFEGFRGHYDMLSERCHPNSAGHNFMFSKLDRSDGTVRFCNENEPERNGQMILAALAPLPLVESISSRLDDLILKVADLHHRIAPVGEAH
jgi:hypothetical protein